MEKEKGRFSSGSKQHHERGISSPETETITKAPGVKETETFADLIGFFAQQLKEKFDPDYGGFEHFPKYPMVDALELAQVAYLYEGGKHWEDIFTHTLLSMYGSAVFDREEGGFFKYSTARDWSIPYYEKTLEDNARILSLLLTAHKLTADQSFARASQEVLKYLHDKLYLPEKGCFAASESAGREYYALPLEDRRMQKSLKKDEHAYVSRNALLVRSLLRASVILAEPAWHDQAVSTLEVLLQHCYRPDKGMSARLRESGESSEEAVEQGSLGVQAAAGLALTAAYQHTGEMRWLDTARHLAKYCLESLSTAGGALSEMPAQKGRFGKKPRPGYDINNNVLCARWFVEMAALSGEEAYLEKASDIVHSFAGQFRKQPLQNAGLALAAFDVRERAAVIDVVGAPGDPELLPLLSTALASFVPPKVVRLLDPAVAHAEMRHEYKEVDRATVFPWLGEHCYERAVNPVELQDIISTLVKERRAHVLFTVKESERV